tara:strand:+ start:285 stop:977 length:693 start_codon:yes stop_codon:yes gene_type:complete
MLPKIETPLFNGTIASTGKAVKFRPFLVKEEKILMLASQSDEFKDLVNACIQIVDNCTFGEVKTEELAMFDLQDLFLQIRKNSVGDEQDFQLKCGSCEKSTPFTLNLDDLKVKGLEDIPSGNIKLDDELAIKMKYPSAMSFANDTDQDDDLSIILSCLESIETADEAISCKDVVREDLYEFIENLPLDAFAKVREFIQAMPVLRHDIEYTCPHCSKEQTVVINGYEHFFA